MRAAALVALTLACTLSTATGWAAAASTGFGPSTSSRIRAGFLALLLLVPALLSWLVDARARASRSAGSWPSTAFRVLSALLLVAVPSWVTTDLPFVLRVATLAAGLVVVSSVVTAAVISPVWFDPDHRTRGALEVARRVAGPLTALVTAAIVTPAPWLGVQRPAVLALSLVPVFVGARRYDLEQLLVNAVPLLREQGQLGRDEVLREIHGALSTELRQLEQHARDRQGTAPELYERAVSVNSGLRETLLLADEERVTSTTADALTASVLTLARAEGAAVSTRVESEQLSATDRELVRYTLHELVAQALAAGATTLDISVREVDGHRELEGREQHCGTVPDRGRLVSVSVSDHTPPLALDRPGALPGPAGSPLDENAGAPGAQLDRRLSALAGAVTVQRSLDGTTTRTASWPVQT